MKKLLLTTALVVWTSASAIAGPVIGEMAPNWTGTDTNGVVHALSDFKGKTVIMEWTNHDCPYVKKHYDSGNMQSLQKEATDNGAVWVSIASSAEGKQGHVTAETGNQVMTDVGSNATAKILDASGEIGKMYDAKTTPHMFVVDPEGTLVYAGAIDSDPSFKQDGIADATNYVKAAWEAVVAGEPVEVVSTQAYGCSVKY
jgi:peroxiredoxin